MNKEVISIKQGIFIMILFLTGSTSIFVVGLDAKKDIWLAIIFAFIIILPMLLIFTRLRSIFPDKDLFDIIRICFGKFIGNLVIIISITYFIYWTADILNNYSFFIWTNNLVNTPKIIIIISLSIICVLGVKGGIELIGRSSQVLAIIAIAGIFTGVLLLIPKMNINNLRPILLEGFKPIFKGSYHVLTLFGQTLAFTFAFTDIKEKKSSFKLYFFGLLFATIFTLMISLTDVLVIGVNSSINKYYPSYVAVSRIDIYGILQRIEVIVSLVFVLGGFIKISILLLCTCKGITRIFNYKDYRFIIIPISLIIINLAYFQYDNVQHYFAFNSEIWAHYFFPFQFILPIIIWIVAEIKNKKNKLKSY